MNTTANTEQPTDPSSLQATVIKGIEHAMSNESHEIHIHHHIHGEHRGPWGRGEGRGKGVEGEGRGPGRGNGPGGSRRRSRHAVMRAFGAVRRGGTITADDFSRLEEHRRDLEQRLADLSDLIETIERDELISPAED